MLSQDKDYRWFKKNKEALKEKYGRAFLVIKDKKVLGAYNTLHEGVNAGAKLDPSHTYIVRNTFEDENGHW